VVEGAVDDAIRFCRAAAQAFEVVKIAALYLGAGGDERLGARLRPRQSEYLMAGVDEFRNDGGADKAGSAGEKNTHDEFSFASVEGHCCNR
jgi:hypothetical protein